MHCEVVQRAALAVPATAIPFSVVATYGEAAIATAALHSALNA
jgi:hypothetical protein